MTTLAVLFFVLLVSFAGKLNPRAAFLAGSVVHAENRKGLEGCSVSLGDRLSTKTNIGGRFAITIDSLNRRTNLGYSVECDEFDRQTGLVIAIPGDTASILVRMIPGRTVTVEILSGDALFEPGESELKPDAVDTIRALGLRLKSSLSYGQLIAVQGHTDDTPYKAGVGKDNWVLSGERAAAAARVLTDPASGVAISICRIAIMGFGPSRPVEPLLPQDPKAERERKRERNRRIEFRKVQGADLAGGRCES